MPCWGRDGGPFTMQASIHQCMLHQKNLHPLAHPLQASSSRRTDRTPILSQYTEYSPLGQHFFSFGMMNTASWRG